MTDRRAPRASATPHFTRTELYGVIVLGVLLLGLLAFGWWSAH